MIIHKLPFFSFFFVHLFTRKEGRVTPVTIFMKNVFYKMALARYIKYIIK